MAAEELGIDGAFVRVHHFARQLASPFPLLAAIGGAHEPDRDRHGRDRHALREPAVHGRGAAAADLISGGRLQLGISRGSPEPALRGSESFGHVPREGRPSRHGARARRAVPRRDRRRRRRAGRHRRRAGSPATLAIQPQSPGLPERIWWGAGTRATAVWTAEQGMNLMSSTLLTEDTGVPFDELQAEQIALFRDRLARGRAGSASRASRSAAASCRSPTTRTAPTSAGGGREARTRSATSTAASRASGTATSASRT